MVDVLGRAQVKLRAQDSLQGEPYYVGSQRGGHSHRVRRDLGAGEDGHWLDQHRAAHPNNRHRFAEGKE